MREFRLLQIFGSFTLFLLHLQWNDVILTKVMWEEDKCSFLADLMLGTVCHIVSETCHFHGWSLLCSVATCRDVCGLLLFWCGLLQSTFKSLKCLPSCYNHAWTMALYIYICSSQQWEACMVKQFRMWLHSINNQCELGEPKHLWKFMRHCIHMNIWCLYEECMSPRWHCIYIALFSGSRRTWERG